MTTNSGYQIWLTAADLEGERVPYQMIGCVSTYELAKALLDATLGVGYDAMLVRF